MNTAPTPSRSAYVQSLHLFTIIIDQTTLKDDLSLIICQLTQSYLELLQSVTFNGIAFDHVCFFLNRLADSREEQIITVLERKISGRDQEWSIPQLIRLDRYLLVAYSLAMFAQRQVPSGRMQPALWQSHRPVLLQRWYFLRQGWSYLHPDKSC